MDATKYEGAITLQNFHLRKHHIAMIAETFRQNDYNGEVFDHVSFYGCFNVGRRSVIAEHSHIYSFTNFSNLPCDRCNHPGIIK